MDGCDTMTDGHTANLKVGPLRAELGYSQYSMPIGELGRGKAAGDTRVPRRISSDVLSCPPLRYGKLGLTCGTAFALIEQTHSNAALLAVCVVLATFFAVAM